MNAPAKISLDGIDHAEIDAICSPFYKLRSEIIDEFAKVERAVVRYLSEKGEKAVLPTQALGNKIKAAKDISPNSKLSKTAKKAADVALDEIAPYLPIRADIVHAKMTISVAIDGEIYSIFVNSKNAHADCPEGRILDEARMRKLQKRLVSLNNRLDAALNPASSPPQPKPGAASGP